VVYFSFEYDNHSLLERLIIMEAAEITRPLAVRLPEVRAAFKVPQSSNRLMAGRLAGTEGGTEAVEALEGYSDRLHLHTSSGADTNLAAMREAIAAIVEQTEQTPFVIVDYCRRSLPRRPRRIVASLSSCRRTTGSPR
jgi:replicative DNA helicase